MSDLPDGPWLNIGCGPSNPSGWINMDGSWQARFAGRPALAWLARHLTGREVGRWPRGIVSCDARRGTRYGSETVAVVYSSHTIEHFYRDEALRFLSEAYRILKPGGICRIVVPDVAAIITWYLEHRGQSPDAKKEPSSEILMKMLSVRPESSLPRGLLGWYRRRTDFDQHKWMYDAEGLSYLFREAGFIDPKLRDYLQSDIPTSQLSVVEKSDRLMNGAGVCVEARK